MDRKGKALVNARINKRNHPEVHQQKATEQPENVKSSRKYREFIDGHGRFTDSRFRCPGTSSQNKSFLKTAGPILSFPWISTAGIIFFPGSER
jgi:hypothetical protein